MNEQHPLLNRIENVSDLQYLNEIERKSLACEIRQLIIETVSRTGGHLASSLGAVELAIAIHTVFKSPEDKIIWDVGHQSYAHKIVTGRSEAFHKLRQSGGVSGFPKRDESEHDVFGAGHASTSVSAALGFAKARDLTGGNWHVVGVIGDGSLTGGLALEGLNNAEQLNTNVIVILNDNKMSISENVGAMSLHLSKLRMAPIYKKVETRAREMVERMPHGKTLAQAAEGISHGVVRLLGSKTGALFEEMGFTYLGPIDGHNTEVLIDVFESAKHLTGPLLIHILTNKGKGYEFAENDSRAFHGVPAFDVNDGAIELSTGNCSYTRAFSETLCELAQEDKRIVAITAAMPDGTGLSRFAEEFPDRFFDVGIAEEHAVTFAAGLAAAGMRPVVAMYSTFLQRAYDQILHDVCLQNLPVVFAVDRAGLVGEDGPTHHGVFDLSFLRHIPGITIAAPKDTLELRDMLATALRHNGPMAIRYPRGGGPCEYHPHTLEVLPIGKSETLLHGDNLCIIAIGSTVYPAVAAAESLSHTGVTIEVINARFAKPLDTQMVMDMLSRSLPILIVEENSLAGGFGSAVLEFAAASGHVGWRIDCLGIPDAFVDHGDSSVLRHRVGIAAESIAEAALRAIQAVTD